MLTTFLPSYLIRPGQGRPEARGRAGARGHCRAQVDGARRGAAQAAGGQGEEDVLQDVQLRTEASQFSSDAWAADPLPSPRPSSASSEWGRQKGGKRGAEGRTTLRLA